MTAANTYDATNLPLATLIEQAVRRGRMPQFIGTTRAVKETALSARQLKHLRETDQISWARPRGTIIYDSAELFEELSRLKIPAKTSETINGTTAATT